MTTNYWDQRIERLNREVFRDSESYVKELRKIYDTETEKIQDSIYSQLLKLQEEAGEISLAEAKKLLNDREKKIFKDSLDDFIKKATGKINIDTEKELNIISRRVRISRLQAMEVELKKTVAGLMSREEKGLFAHLGGTYEKRYYKELYELQRITGYKSVQSVNKSELSTLIKNPWTSDGQEFSERIWGRGEKLTTSLRDNLIRDIARGNSPKESARNIQRLFDVSKASASRLVFTETAAVNAKATQDSYEKLGVKQYQILATLDLKTSDICRSMDSKIFDYKDYRIGITAPPFHPNCRSDTVPYFGDEFEKEIDQGIGRMARDPKTGKSEPVENLTYEDWYKKYVDGENSEEKGYNKYIDLGKFGKVTDNPNIKVNWEIKGIHSKDKLKERNISKSDVEKWVENGIPVEQIKNNKYAFVTKEGVAVVRKDGKLITAWAAIDFDKDMLEIIRKLFGDE